MLLLRVLEDALGTEHLLVVQTVELYFLRWMLLAELYGSMLQGGGRVRWVGCGGHGQACEHLVVHWQVVH